MAPRSGSGFNGFSRRDFLASGAVYLASVRLAQAQQVQAPVAASVVDAESIARRKEYLTVLRGILPGPPRRAVGKINAFDASWDAWLQRTGELPPDFAAIRPQPELPDPLVAPGGARILTPADWDKQRAWMREQVQYWFTGALPPPPGNVRGTVKSSEKQGDVTVQEVELQFGPENKGRLRLELLIPPGNGPFPMLMTNHPRKRPWVNTAVRRGYAGCIVYAIDSIYNEPDDSDSWISLYPEYDFAATGRWAWGAMRAMDYVETLPWVNPKQIAIGGHSRNSKSGLYAAALDERFAAVAASRGNSGDSMVWRYNTDVFGATSIDIMETSLPHLFHPRLRFFVGQEHKLPIDQNHVLSLIAPRGLVLAHAYSEHEGNTMGVEQAYRSTLRTYEFLGHPERISLYQEPGEHPSTAQDIEVYFDFFDTLFGRANYPKKEDWVFGYTLDNWKRIAGKSLDPRSFPVRNVGDFLLDKTGAKAATVEAWTERKTDIQGRIRQFLGEEPTGVPYFPKRPARIQVGGSVTTDDGHLGVLLERPLTRRGMRGYAFPFGDDLKGDLYFQADANNRVDQNKKYPVVVLLHPYAYSTGYSAHSIGTLSYLTAAGYAVLAFDQIGFGARADQAKQFYQRYPRWSYLGKMVSDTRAALDMLVKLQVVDASKIFLVGEALGAKVALLTAAMDDRPTGVISASGFAPLRLDTPEKGTEGLGHYTEVHGLLPHLHAFKGQESRLPADWDEILAAVAPRPTLVYAPTMDRYYPVDDVRRAVAAAREVYQLHGKADNLELRTPVEFGRFAEAARTSAFDWLAGYSGRPTYAELEKVWSGTNGAPDAPATELN